MVHSCRVTVEGGDCPEFSPTKLGLSPSKADGGRGKAEERTGEQVSRRAEEKQKGNVHGLSPVHLLNSSPALSGPSPSGRGQGRVRAGR